MYLAHFPRCVGLHVSRLLGKYVYRTLASPTGILSKVLCHEFCKSLLISGNSFLAHFYILPSRSVSLDPPFHSFSYSRLSHVGKKIDWLGQLSFAILCHQSSQCWLNGSCPQVSMVTEMGLWMHITAGTYITRAVLATITTGRPTQQQQTPMLRPNVHWWQVDWLGYFHTGRGGGEGSAFSLNSTYLPGLSHRAEPALLTKDLPNILPTKVL
jgi:hypothetical protein